MTKRCTAMSFLALGLIFSAPWGTTPPRADDKSATAAIGAKAPDRGSLRDLRGNRRSLYSFKDNRAIVLAFLGADCPLSNLYVPRLLELEKKYRAKGAQFLAVYANEHEDLDRVALHTHD